MLKSLGGRSKPKTHEEGRVMELKNFLPTRPLNKQISFQQLSEDWRRQWRSRRKAVPDTRSCDGKCSVSQWSRRTRNVQHHTGGWPCTRTTAAGKTEVVGQIARCSAIQALLNQWDMISDQYAMRWKLRWWVWTAYTTQAEASEAAWGVHWNSVEDESAGSVHCGLTKDSTK